ncbi:MAG TPA: hypothetical protein VIE67_03085 [Rudaea sp.]|jgi:hypothetical protein|uniref:hypothetical protein n=1 Tax=Rudaea sp. TaxID=2136325 RepID=UPI002F95E761
MKRLESKTMIAALGLLISAGAFAAGGMHSAAPQASSHTMTTHTVSGPTHTTGQPNQSCGSASAPNTPGHAAAAPGSAFNPDGKAGTMYAGQQPQNSRNPVSVSQYDVACFHQQH